MQKNSASICRHNSLNDDIQRSLVKAGVPSVKEPNGLVRNDGKRPDGVTQIPWSSGRCATWDVTVCDTLASSYASLSSISAGSVAERAALMKREKYSQLLSNYTFFPIAFEAYGPINKEGFGFLRELGRRLSLTSGDPREFSFLMQRLSITIQRFNAVSFKQSFL